MARSHVIYLVYDAHQEWVVAAFTVKHEAITSIKRYLAEPGNSGRALELHRIRDAGRFDDAWQRVEVE